MDAVEDMQEIEEEISPIVRIFERLAFERGHEVHDLVSSMTEVFSLSEVGLTSPSQSLTEFVLGNTGDVRRADRMRESRFRPSTYEQGSANAGLSGHVSPCGAP